ncbi:MAG TPA: trigger factor [Trebonia sp.]|nr:trigger factor [Trebonia sp.]
MKTDVEELSPTRVRLSVEVSFEELKPSLDKAYKEVAQQARIPGFRPGKVPPRVIDMRIGRGAVLTEAVNDALPGFYSKAVQEADVFALGQPDVEITQLDDGKELTFTAEVEVRPKFELPDLATLDVTVDNAEVTDEDIDEYLNNLRERFASLKTAQRAAAADDYVTIDLSASVDGELVEDAQASGLSYQIGSGTMLEGLDDALTGLSAGESATFKTELAGGAAEGQEADVTVTVQAVKTKELPDLDDDFAQLASEFDTLEELREDTRKQLERVKKLQQTSQARDKAVDALVDAIDIPLPEKFVEHELHHARENIDAQLAQMRTSKEDYLASIEKTEEEFETDLETQSQRNVKVSFVLDELARAENLDVNQAELSYFVADQAQRMGVSPEQFARQLTESGQIGVAVTEVLRGKAATIVAERVKVADEAGNPIDVKSQIEELNADVDAMLAAQAAEQAGAGPDEGEGDIEAGDRPADVAGTTGSAGEDEAGEEPAAEDTAAEDTAAEGTGAREDAAAEASTEA